jgi:sensor histidine kinase YesM
MSSLITIRFFGEFITKNLFILLCCVPFLNNLSRSKRKIIIETAVFCAVFAFLKEWLAETVYSIDNIWDWKYLPLYSRASKYTQDLIFFTLSILYLRKAVNISFEKLFFIFCVVISYMTFPNIINIYMRGLYKYFVNDINLQLMIGNIVDIAVTVLLSLLLGWVLYRFAAPHLRTVKSQNIKYLWIVPVVLYVLYCVNVEFITFYASAELRDAFSVFVFFAFNVMSAFLYIVLFRIHNSSVKTAQAEYQLKHQSEHYKLLQSHIAETKQAHHDLRHHLSLIKSYIDMGETEKLTMYISEYESALPDDTALDYCENYAVNSILRYYIGIARREGVRVTLKIDVPENTGVSDSDLCVVFGNCIENAIEACRKMNEGEKFIKIDAGLTGEMITITVDNSFNGTIDQTGGVFMSHKREGEGIGISSVRAVARKYDGVVRFEGKGDVFQASIMLKLKSSVHA